MVFFKKKQKKFISPSSELFDSVIGDGMEVHGRLVAHKSIRIDGAVFGNVEIVEGKKNITVAIGSKGKVQGDISGFRVLVGGTVEGNINASERVELHGAAKVTGDITYVDIGIEPGAQVVGLLIKRVGRKNEIVEANRILKKIQDSNKPQE